jgi:hypothetical protein
VDGGYVRWSVPRSFRTSLRELLPVEEPAFQQRQHLFARERARVGRAAVSLEHADVVLEGVVRALERILELVPLEDRDVGAGLARVAQVRIHGAADDPERSGTPLDPDDDPLLLADVVDADEHTLRIPDVAGARSHAPGIQSRSVTAFKNLFSFLFQRSSAEEHVARYVVREHDRGRPLSEILEDKYVQNRLTPEQQRRLLDRPEVIEAISGDMLEAAKATIGTGTTAS